METSEKTKQSLAPRSQHLDIVKGIGILLVLIGHAVQYTQPDFNSNLVFRFIYSFHMPLFFFVSGYLAAKSIDNAPTLHFLFKKVRQLLTPFLAWYFLFDFLILKTGNGGLLNYIRNLAAHPDYGLWFLWVLFLCFVTYILSALIYKYLPVKNLGIQLLLCFIFIATIYFEPINEYGLGMLRTELPFFFTGVLIALNATRLKHTKYLQEITVITFVLLVWGWFKNQPPIFVNDLNSIGFDASTISILITLFNYTVAMSGIGVVWYAAKAITNRSIANTMAWFGQNSMDIYVIQIYLIKIVGSVGLMDEGSSFVAVCSVFSFLTFASIGISRFILQQSRILTYLLLGK